MRTLFDFPGGIHPPDNKQQSTQTAIEVLPIPPLLILPLQQHIGVAAVPVVNEGQRVVRGQLIAKAGDGLSAALHAPCDGEISFIGLHAVTNDSGLMDQCIALATDESNTPENDNESDFLCLSNEDIRERIAQAGIVGLGGAGFPSAAKLSTQAVQYLMINGAECEPYISCDDRLMQERASVIVHGIQILMRLLSPTSVLLVIEDNKPDAIAAIALAIQDSPIELVVIPTKYPSGAQKQLIQNVLGIEIASGTHSIDAGVVMYNVATCYAVARAVVHGEPLLSRIVTVTGNAVTRPGNYEVALGTPIDFVLECAGLNPNKLARVIMGGPLMGITVPHTHAPVTKLTNCLIASSHDEIDNDSSVRECIRCGDCVSVCPASLLPQQLYWMIRSEQYHKADDLFLSACIECGACAYVCPSHIPLVHYYRHGKSALRAQRREQQLANDAKERFEWRQQRLQKQKRDREANRLVSVTEPVAAEASTAPIDPVEKVIDNKADQIAAAVARAKAKREAMKKVETPENDQNE